MAGFRFAMQSILDIKEKLESQAKQNFAAAQGRLLEEEEELSALQRRRQEYESRSRQCLEGTLDLRQIEEIHNAMVVLDGYIAKQKEEVLLAERRVERAREDMAEAMKERKTYETLREKALEEYRAEESRAEGKIVDELVSYTFGRKREES